ncbi:Nudix family hydrolase [Dyella halodurans]
MHVMAGVLLDARGHVLLAQRPPGKHLAGLWEFPGGKLDADETAVAGLVRELREELGIEAEVGEPLIRVPWRYGDRSLLLDARVVRSWQGEPMSLDGQALQWRDPAAVDLAMLSPADRPILRALQLPARYPITPADVSVEAFEAWRLLLLEAIEHGLRLVLLRFPLWAPEQVRELAAAVLPVARERGAQLLLSGDVAGALALGHGVGVQLKALQLTSLHERPLPWEQLVGASCHDQTELARASAWADFATLSPVSSTATHPAATPLGWPVFQSMVEAAAVPVYALGGMTAADAEVARRAGGQGVAGIRGFW